VFIYKVTNKLNGKVYIGKTVRPVDVRWAQHLWFAKMGGGCPYLGAAIRKYGSEAFEVEQLIQAISEDELNKMEKGFIQQFQSYRRELGYNLTLGQKIQNANSKTYEFLSPTGGTVVITNLKAFCLEQGLNASHMNSTYHGSRKQHKGWTRCSI